MKRKSNVTVENYIEKQKELIESIKSHFEIGGIFSLSEKRNISLMWCHYADSHKGFCIGYNTRKDNDLGNEKCKEVTYGKYPSFSFTQMWQAIERSDEEYGKIIFDTMVLSKDINWKYEYEWRILYEESNMLVIPNFQISSITFGMDMPEAQRSIVKKLMKGKGVEYFEAYKKTNSYNVGIRTYA